MYCEGLRVSEITCDIRRVEKIELTLLRSLVVDELERIEKLEVGVSDDLLARLHNMQNFFSEMLQRWNDLEQKRF